jgi:hypothetical protein
LTGWLYDLVEKIKMDNVSNVNSDVSNENSDVNDENFLAMLDTALRIMCFRISGKGNL